MTSSASCTTKRRSCSQVIHHISSTTTAPTIRRSRAGPTRTRIGGNSYGITWDDSSPRPGAVRGLHQGRHRARHPAERRLVLLARQPTAGDGRGRLGEVRRLRPPADRLGQGPRHPDPLVLPLAARALLLRLAQGQQAAAGVGRLSEHGVDPADGEGRREDRAPDVEAGRGVRHPDAPAHQARRDLLRAVRPAPARRSSPARRRDAGFTPSRSARSTSTSRCGAGRRRPASRRSSTATAGRSTRSPASGCRQAA